MSTTHTTMALVPVRSGQLASGGDEVIAEAGGRVVLVGSGTTEAAESCAGLAREIWCAEAPHHGLLAWAERLAPILAPEHLVLLPGSPDGRQLAPHLAHALDRALFSSVVRACPGRITSLAAQGRAQHITVTEAASIAVFEVGTRGAERTTDPAPRPRQLHLDFERGLDPELVEFLPADPATIDLAEAGRVVAGGAGLSDAGVLDSLGELGLRLGASLGATRVLTDAGWIDHARQIGTTGVEIDPDLYLAFGISGAVQHIMGIGDPDHVISVNLDPSCPMMARADLAIVADADAVIAQLDAVLGADR